MTSYILSYIYISNNTILNLIAPLALPYTYTYTTRTAEVFQKQRFVFIPTLVIEICTGTCTDDNMILHHGPFRDLHGHDLNLKPSILLFNFSFRHDSFQETETLTTLLCKRFENFEHGRSTTVI